MKLIRNIKVKPNKKEILIRMGYPSEKKVKNKKIIDLVEENINNSKKYSDKILSISNFYEINNREKWIKKIDNANENYSYCCFYIVTAGQIIQNKIHLLLENNKILEALILDAMATYFTEYASTFMQNNVIEKAKKMKLYPRKIMFPGNNLTIDLQKIIFQKIDASKIGVSLSDNYMMIPLKTISSIILFNENENDSYTIRSVDVCLSCSYRGRCSYNKN
jgi:cobalamin-dependent methionine synthase I